MKREKLLDIQIYITLALLVLLTVVYAHQSWGESGGFYKLIVAPVGAVSLFLFALFGFNRPIQDFNEEEAYRASHMVMGIVIMLIATLIMKSVILAIGRNLTTLERLVFVFSALVCFTLFLHVRIRNLWSMSIVTGMAEGIIFFLVFFDR